MSAAAALVATVASGIGVESDPGGPAFRAYPVVPRLPLMADSVDQAEVYHGQERRQSNARRHVHAGRDEPHEYEHDSNGETENAERDNGLFHQFHDASTFLSSLHRAERIWNL